MSGNVPSNSKGFWVAITMNGGAMGMVIPSIVACLSLIASMKALCVFGASRFISSIKRKFEKMGPFRREKSLLSWSYMRTPMISAGWLSTAHWNRANSHPVSLARVLTIDVFPVPGVPSMRRWPPESRAIMQSSTRDSFPTMKSPILFLISL